MTRAISDQVELRKARAAATPPGLKRLLQEIRGCRICAEAPKGLPLPHAPKPVLQVRATARLGVFGQAPGLRAHDAGLPFKDPSGVRLRAWMGVSEDEFYDPDRIATIPMGFCFPGYDAKGSDLPPRRECAPAWRARLMAELPNLELVLLIGGYAQRWHLPHTRGRPLTETVRDWRAIYEGGSGPGPRFLPLPHPSWRNTGWLKRNSWFEAEVLPVLQSEVRRLLSPLAEHSKGGQRS